MATTDFNDWLDQLDLSDYEEIDSLYRAVDEINEYDCFKMEEARGTNNGWVLTCDGYDIDPLLIRTEYARQTFLHIIEDRYCDGMSEEGWYDYHRQMEKDD